MPVTLDAVASTAAQPAVRDDRDPPLVSGPDVAAVLPDGQGCDEVGDEFLPEGRVLINGRF
ncbi:hypothetical protein [Bradyrhizobium sp. 21]|uniref:hypothetical protein n=1 Tax=Bradyrhizobium sp. 21 TaxID=2782666 RepID=UPI001FF801B0|nr:hypothetical protein [Bradyrhizobium sp. 21]MCK1384782.1 hypothetical protein [Bradyrhizobium sp. 21]